MTPISFLEMCNLVKWLIVFCRTLINNHKAFKTITINHKAITQDLSLEHKGLSHSKVLGWKSPSFPTFR